MFGNENILHDWFSQKDTTLLDVENHQRQKHITISDLLLVNKHVGGENV